MTKKQIAKIEKEHDTKLAEARKLVDGCILRKYWGVFDDLALLACGQLALDGCLHNPTEEQMTYAIRIAWEDASNPRLHTAINVTMKNIGSLLLNNSDLRHTLVAQARKFGCHVTG